MAKDRGMIFSQELKNETIIAEYKTILKFMKDNKLLLTANERFNKFDWFINCTDDLVIVFS